MHVYSLGYMDGDVRFTWFFAVLSLFTGGDAQRGRRHDLIQLLVGWEIMGVCSYLLIGHWWEEKENSDAAIKAFITTRIGDVPFMFGIFALIAATGFTTSTSSEIGEAGEPDVSSRSSPRWPRSCCSAGRSASPRSSRSTSGCPTRWPAPRRSRP